MAHHERARPRAPGAEEDAAQERAHHGEARPARRLAHEHDRQGDQVQDGPLHARAGPLHGRGRRPGAWSAPAL